MRVCTGRHVAPLLCVYLRAGHARRGKLSPPPQARPSPLLLPFQTQCSGTPLPSWHWPHHPPPPPARLVQEWTFHLSSRCPSISEAKGHGPKGPQLGGAPPPRSWEDSTGPCWESTLFSSTPVSAGVRIHLSPAQLHPRAPTSEMPTWPVGTTEDGWARHLRGAALGEAKGTVTGMGNRVSPT